MIKIKALKCGWLFGVQMYFIISSCFVQNDKYPLAYLVKAASSVLSGAHMCYFVIVKLRLR